MMESDEQQPPNDTGTTLNVVGRVVKGESGQPFRRSAQ
jgi:hypothetical protein